MSEEIALFENLSAPRIVYSIICFVLPLVSLMKQDHPLQCSATHMTYVSGIFRSLPRLTKCFAHRRTDAEAVTGTILVKNNMGLMT